MQVILVHRHTNEFCLVKIRFICLVRDIHPTHRISQFCIYLQMYFSTTAFICVVLWLIFWSSYSILWIASLIDGLNKIFDVLILYLYGNREYVLFLKSPFNRIKKPSGPTSYSLVMGFAGEGLLISSLRPKLLARLPVVESPLAIGL